MDILLLMGLAIAVGFGGGTFFQRFKTPQVVGYIIMGVILGNSLLGILKPDMTDRLAPISSFALGVIGFMIGGEMKLSVFKKFGRSIFTILFAEVFGAMLLVTLAVWLLTQKLYVALIFGALATATAPAATVDVLWEYKARGELTTTLLAIVALDDALALMVYAFASAYAKMLISGKLISIAAVLIKPLTEIVSAIVLGCFMGVALGFVSERIEEEKHYLGIVVSSILVCTGLANHFHLSQIMANMFLGATLANLGFHRGYSAFRLMEGITFPIYIIFFVLIGSRLNVSLLPQMGLIGMVYILARTGGKFAGSYFGARYSQASESVRKYLGFALFSQAGVAIGLSIAVHQDFSQFNSIGQELSLLVVNVIAATTFVVQMIGPPCVKYAIYKAGEIGQAA